MTNFDMFVSMMKDERQHQATRWADGTQAGLDVIDDKSNDIMDWPVFICKYATSWLPGVFRPYKRDVYIAFRHSMVKVGTLAFSAWGWAGRRLDEIDAEHLEMPHS